MRCEICGKYILEGKRIKVEGSTIVVCEKCAKYGEFVKKEEPYKKIKPPKEKGIAPTSFNFESEKERPVKEPEVELEDRLVENFHHKIREKREKEGMKQEDLGKKINEPASLIHRLESGKFKPSPKLIQKIEKSLGIKLLKKQEEVNFQPNLANKGEKLTLGDLVVIKKERKRGEK